MSCIDVSRLLALAVLWVGLLTCGSCLAQPGVEQLVTTEHRIQGSSGLRYIAQAGRVPIREAGSEEVHGYMFFVAYRVRSTGKPRPVTFLWNGGPGATSSTLHLESIGPKRFDEAGQPVDNQETALSATDLVFVDAIGTGFSRPTRKEYAAEFYQTRGDVAAFTEFVRAWRLMFDADDAPLFIGGESWGSYRAAAVANNLEKAGVRVGGIILISGRAGLPPGGAEEDLVALRTVELPRVALHFGKLSPALGRDVDTIERDAHAWVLNTYVPALRHLKTLSGAEREAIAAQLALFSGLPAEQIDRTTLTIMPQQFLDELLRDEGKKLDTFYMLRVRDETDHSESRRAAINAYLRRALGYRSDMSYVNGGSSDLEGYSPDGAPLRSVGDQWDYTQGFFTKVISPEAARAADTAAIERGEPPGGQDIPVTAEALTLNPRLKVLIVNGRYDSLMSCASTEERVRRLEPALRDRITFRCYPGGHMLYRVPEVRRQFRADLQAFVR